MARAWLARAQTLTVLRRADARHALEQPSKEGRVLISNVRRDVVDAAVAGFQYLLGLLDADGLHVIFAGVVTAEFSAVGDGTRVVMTESGVYLDGGDSAQGHEDGWAVMLDSLGDYLKRRLRHAA